MLLYEILRSKPKKEKASGPTAKPSVNQIISSSDRLASLDRHMNKNPFKLYDMVHFKRRKKFAKVTGMICAVETDIDKILWASEGVCPYYLCVEVTTPEKNGTESVHHVWTNETKLMKGG